MAIKVNLDKVMVNKKMSLNKLAEDVGITVANLSNLKTGKANERNLKTGVVSDINAL